MKQMASIWKAFGCSLMYCLLASKSFNLYQFCSEIKAQRSNATIQQRKVLVSLKECQKKERKVWLDRRYYKATEIRLFAAITVLSRLSFYAYSANRSVLHDAISKRDIFGFFCILQKNSFMNFFEKYYEEKLLLS